MTFFKKCVNYVSRRVMYRSFFRRPWEIGRPQPVFTQLVKNGEIQRGRVLDVGCGTGELAMFLAENGFSVSGIDINSDTVALAKRRAVKRNVKVDFHIGNVLNLDRYFERGEFDAVTDCSLFHNLWDDEWPVYARQIARVIRDGGKYFMACFSDKGFSIYSERRHSPGGRGARRIAKNDIEVTLSPFLNINYLRDAFLDEWHRPKARAYITVATKARSSSSSG